MKSPRATGPFGTVARITLGTILVGSAVIIGEVEVREATLGLLVFPTVMLLAAWRGYAGRESLAISNWLLGRDDQVGCVVVGPIDAFEARAARAVAY